jgi:hypothetical protein
MQLHGVMLKSRSDFTFYLKSLLNKYISEA